MYPSRSPIMPILFHPVVLEHKTGLHPENPKRLLAFQEMEPSELYNGREYLSLVHTPTYLEYVEATCSVGGHVSPETIVSPGSFKAASYAVGASIAAARQGGFALIRPPGHHAYADRGTGFCLFNNVAIAAKYLAQQGKRVLILDFDGHLGDGTSHIFYGDDQVLFWSLHQYPAFPGHGFVDEIGEGKGKGFTINVPLPPGSADDIFLKAIEEYLPIALEFKPDVVALSAGFDAHQYDLLLDLRLSTDGFYQLGKLLRSNFSSMFACLEGGYHVEEMKKCLEAFLAGIQGEENPAPEEPTLSGLRVWETFEINLYAGLARLRPYWEV